MGVADGVGFIPPAGGTEGGLLAPVPGVIAGVGLTLLWGATDRTGRSGSLPIVPHGNCRQSLLVMKAMISNRIPFSFDPVYTGESNRRRMERILKKLLRGEIAFPSSAILKKRGVRAKRVG